MSLMWCHVNLFEFNILGALISTHHAVFNVLMISVIQKRDIQLLKAYMRAIRSANPNLQNLEESIEYNEILEWVKCSYCSYVTVYC